MFVCFLLSWQCELSNENLTKRRFFIAWQVNIFHNMLLEHLVAGNIAAVMIRAVDDTTEVFGIFRGRPNGCFYSCFHLSIIISYFCISKLILIILNLELYMININGKES